MIFRKSLNLSVFQVPKKTARHHPIPPDRYSLLTMLQSILWYCFAGYKTLPGWYVLQGKFSYRCMNVHVINSHFVCFLGKTFPLLVQCCGYFFTTSSPNWFWGPSPNACSSACCAQKPPGSLKVSNTCAPPLEILTRLGHRAPQ